MCVCVCVCVCVSVCNRNLNFDRYLSLKNLFIVFSYQQRLFVRKKHETVLYILFAHTGLLGLKHDQNVSVLPFIRLDSKVERFRIRFQNAEMLKTAYNYI
jgi:hypothetical protein